MTVCTQDVASPALPVANHLGRHRQRKAGAIRMLLGGINCERSFFGAEKETGLSTGGRAIRDNTRHHSCQHQAFNISLRKFLSNGLYLVMVSYLLRCLIPWHTSLSWEYHDDFLMVSCFSWWFHVVSRWHRPCLMMVSWGSRVPHAFLMFLSSLSNYGLVYLSNTDTCSRWLLSISR